ncbi:hypothetical protein MOUN0_K08020 [Monosporozyma unispora]|nr:hypothetical protein C6P44_003174 [Kazachstania unispora]
MSQVSLTNSEKSIDQNLASLSLNSPIKNSSNTNTNPTSAESDSQIHYYLPHDHLDGSFKSNHTTSNNNNEKPTWNSFIKKDMKRKRLDSHTNISSLTPLTAHTPVPSPSPSPALQVPITPVEESKPVEQDEKPLSATAKIMLKLYGDKSQQTRETNKEKVSIATTPTTAPIPAYTKQQKYERSPNSQNSNNNNTQHTTSYTVNVLKTLNKNADRSTTRLPDLKKLKTPTNDGKLTADNFYKMKVKPDYIGSNTTLSSVSSVSSAGSQEEGFDGDVKDSIFNDNVEVILKWKDHLPDLEPSTKISIISKDMVSTLHSLQIGNEPSPTHFNRETNSLTMTYDPENNEWYMKDLFLPPGIYKLQFLINSNLYHSDYLPTATNTTGNIVNWFEVLPGYDTVEPYREENKIMETRHHKQQRSTTSLTDFAGISRSSSTIGKGNSASSLRMLGIHGFTMLEKPKPTVQYSNEIPEIFKFDNIDEDDEDEDESENDDNKIERNFDLTLSRVVDSNQDSLFANIQKIAKMNTEEAEEYFLNKFKVPDLPVYLNSTYLNKNFNNNDEINHIIPHVNLKHLLTTSIKDNIVCVGCTTRYEGKFITQVIYAPCDYEK